MIGSLRSLLLRRYDIVMKFRTIALALALACGFTASVEAKTNKPKTTHHAKSPKHKAHKNKAPKAA